MACFSNSSMESSENLNLIYLLSGSYKALPPSYVKLRSYLNVHSSEVAEHLNLKLPKHMTAKSITCPHCFTSWSSSYSYFKLIPGKKLSADRRLRKRLRKLDDSSEPNQSRNKMILKCNICNKISKLSLLKKTKVVGDKREIIEEVVHKKKKKKKDKSAGIKTAKAPELKKLNNSQKKKNKVNSQSDFIKIENNTSHKTPQKLNSHKSNQVAINPFATKIQNKMSEKDKKWLKDLQEKLKQEKTPARRQLEGFLSLVKS